MTLNLTSTVELKVTVGSDGPHGVITLSSRLQTGSGYNGPVCLGKDKSTLRSPVSCSFFAFLLLLAGACTAPPDSSGAEPTLISQLRSNTPRPVATRAGTAVPSATVLAGAESTFNAAEVQAVRDTVDSALAARDAGRLAPMMLDRLDLFRGEELQRTLQRDEAIVWLNSLAASVPQVQTVDEVPHFALLNLVTAPWVVQPPLNSAQISFKLHRYDPSGRQSPYAGAWKIDGLAY